MKLKRHFRIGFRPLYLCGVLIFIVLCALNSSKEFKGQVNENIDHKMDNNSNNLNLKLPLNLPHRELMQYVVNNQQILDNADALIEVAKILDKSHWHGGILPQNLIREFIPDKGDIVLPGGFYKDLDIKYEWERRKMPVEVELTKQIEEFLERIVRKMSVAHIQKVKPRKGAKMEIYDTYKNLTAWQRWHNTITQFNMYKSNDPLIDEVLHDLRTLDLIEMYQPQVGTQFKLMYYLANNGRAMFQPMRYPRDVETFPDHVYFSDYERHTAEIAAFNLDRCLGFHRVPPTTGRWFNVTQDVMRMADTTLLDTFFVSPVGNMCFEVECADCRHSGDAVCGHKDMIEGSMKADLPDSGLAERLVWQNPWKRSYHKRKKADWETNNNYCYEVRDNPPYNTGRRLLDLMDMAVFDFLQGNLDRHHYETFQDFGNFTFTLHLDNGRGFGKSFEDDLSILAPIYQCCLCRYSTLEKLFKFYTGPQHLSDVMRKSMASDPLTPILLERHLRALDRRVKIILKTVYQCIDKNGLNQVVLDDGF